jgi:hypothetical protein
MFAGNCVPTWPAATSKHLSDVPSTLIRIAELHVLFCGLENRDKRLLTILVCHSSLCDSTVVAVSPFHIICSTSVSASHVAQKSQS